MVSYWKSDALKLKVAVELEVEDKFIWALFPERDLTQPEQVPHAKRTLISLPCTFDVIAQLNYHLARHHADHPELYKLKRHFYYGA